MPRNHPRFSLRLACVFAVALAALALMPFVPLVRADNVHVDQPKVIRISGPISSQAFSKLNLELMGFYNSDPWPAGLIVLLNSPGGDGDIAMQMGRLLRKHDAHVFVSKQCDSACVFVFMGGVVRAANINTLGVHAGRLTQMTDDGKVVREVDAKRSLNHSFQLTTFNRDIRLYLDEMGIKHGILDVILAHQTTDVYKLSAADMSSYGVVGFNNPYLNQRIQALTVINPTKPINRITFYNRTMSVPARCRPAEASDRNFVECYQRTLAEN